MYRRKPSEWHYNVNNTKLTVCIRSISHIINRFLFKGLLNSQPLKGQIMCQRLSNALKVTFFVSGTAWIWTQSVQLQSPIHRIRRATQVHLENKSNRVVLTVMIIFIAKALGKYLTLINIYEITDNITIKITIILVWPQSCLAEFLRSMMGQLNQVMLIQKVIFYA